MVVNANCFHIGCAKKQQFVAEIEMSMVYWLYEVIQSKFAIELVERVNFQYGAHSRASMCLCSKMLAGRALQGTTERYGNVIRTLEIVFHKGHWIVFLASTHLSHTRRKARNGKDNNVANLLRRSHACKVLP